MRVFRSARGVGLNFSVFSRFSTQEVDGVDLLVFNFRTDDWFEGPVACPFGPAGNPFLEQINFLGAQVPVGIGRGIRSSGSEEEIRANNSLFAGSPGFTGA